MRVRMVRTYCGWQADTIQEVPDGIAELLLHRSIAEPVAERSRPKPTKKRRTRRGRDADGADAHD